MSSINTPNMNLVVPLVGNEPGPTYAQDINNDLSILDAHDHTAGNGVAITPSAININSALTFSNNLATNLAGLTLLSQSNTPAVLTVYANSNDLYFVDGVGNNIRLTQAGAVAGTPGSIANLVAPASATYNSASKTFVFQSGVSLAGNLDGGSLTLRNVTPNSTFGVSLSAPASLASNYSLVLPTVPVATSFMTLDSSGSMAPGIATANGITASNIANNTITAAQIANNTITATQIANGTIGGTQISTVPFAQVTPNTTVPSVTVIGSSQANTSATIGTVTLTRTKPTTGTGAILVVLSPAFNGAGGGSLVGSGAGCSLAMTGTNMQSIMPVAGGFNGPLPSICVVGLANASQTTYTVTIIANALSGGQITWPTFTVQLVEL